MAYWNFNEGEGTTLTDLSGNGNDGTIEGAVRMLRVPLIAYLLMYQPTNGTDSFTYVVSDGLLTSDDANVSPLSML